MFLTLLSTVLVWLLASPVVSGAEGPYALRDQSNSNFNLGTKDQLAALTFGNGSPTTPFIGAGIAEAGPTDKQQVDLYEQPSEKTLEDLEYKIGFGVDYSLRKNTGLTLGYQWNTGSTSEILKNGIGNLSPDQENHHLSVGIKIDF